MTLPNPGSVAKSITDRQSVYNSKELLKAQIAIDLSQD